MQRILCNCHPRNQGRINVASILNCIILSKTTIKKTMLDKKQEVKRFRIDRVMFGLDQSFSDKKIAHSRFVENVLLLRQF